MVVGGGMAGLTAAARGASEGASVAVVECADELGGSARYAGYLWTAPSDEVLAEVDPHGDPVLRRALVAGFDDAVEWIRSLGVPVGDEVVILRYGRGRHIDTAAYVRACQKLIASSGGEILLDASVERLVGEQEVIGVDVRRSDRALRRVEAPWTVLETGGYQADRDLTAQLIHPNAILMPIRSNPASTGAGLRLATGWGPPPGPVTPVSTGTSSWPTCHWTSPCSSPTRRSTTRSTRSPSTAMERASSTRRSATTSRPWPRSSNRTLERSSWPISSCAMGGCSAPTSRA